MMHLVLLPGLLLLPTVAPAWLLLPVLLLLPPVPLQLLLLLSHRLPQVAPLQQLSLRLLLLLSLLRQRQQPWRPP